MGFDVSRYNPLTERFENGSYISKADAQKHRIEYAQLLERDIAQLAKAELNA
jgi:hypothetical protein